MIVLQEAFEFVHGFFDLMNGRQGNDTEMVGAYPVEACALDEQDFFTHEQVVDEFHVVMNAVHFGIDFGEHIHRAHWFDAGNSGNLVDQFPCLIALFQQATAGQDKLVDALIAAQGRLNSVLHRCIGTQTHGREHVEAFDIAFGMMFRAVEHHPALAETGHAVGFGEAVKRNGQQVGGEGGNVMVYGTIIKNFVVNLVGKNNQAVFTR